MEVQPYLSLTRHVYTPWVLLASKKWWDTLSTDEQKADPQGGRASRDFERKDSRADSTKAMTVLKDSGMKINTVSPEELQRLREKAQPVVDKYTQDLGPDLVKQLQDEINKVRARADGRPLPGRRFPVLIDIRKRRPAAPGRAAAASFQRTRRAPATRPAPATLIRDSPCPTLPAACAARNGSTTPRTPT